MIGLNAALSFLTSRLGMVAIAAVLGCWFGYSAASKGAAVRALQSEKAALTREVAQARADLARANAAASQAAHEAEGLRSLQRDLAGKVEAYEKELADRAATQAPVECERVGVCRIDRSDVDRLRGLE